MNTSAKGSRLERKIRKDLEAAGAILTMRSAGSKGPIDVIGLFPGPWVVLVQCKAGGAIYVSVKERRALESLAESLNCEAWLAFSGSLSKYYPSQHVWVRRLSFSEET